MLPSYTPKLPGLNISVGSFLPRILMPSSEGLDLAPIDMVEPGALAVCIYNPAAVNPFPLPPPGLDYPARMALLDERDVALYVISGLSPNRLASWREQVGLAIPYLSDEKGEFAAEVGIPVKQVEGRNFRTHAAFVLHEDRVLAILLETDLAHHFEGLLAALDVAEGREPGRYELPDKPTY
ncbi:MAG TPA: redoxin domain-containing protein [Anaerolineae bacterium]|nr:redoxin domain-containing protein [Anaerolineae bacterium]